MDPAGNSRRVLRRAAAIAAVGVAALLVLLVLAVLLVLRSERSSTWAVRQVLSRVQVYPGAQLHLASLRVHPSGKIELREMSLAEADTLQVASAARAWLHLDWSALWNRTAVIESLVVEAPRLDFATLRRGLARRPAGKPRQEASKGTPWQVRIASARIEAGQFDTTFRSKGRPQHLLASGISMHLSDVALGRAVELQLDSLVAEVQLTGQPRPMVLQAQGGMHDGRATLGSLRLDTPVSHVSLRCAAPVLEGAERLLANLELDLAAEPLAGDDLRPFLGSVPAASAVRATVHVRLAGERLAGVSGTSDVVITELRLGTTRVPRAALATRWSDGQAQVNLDAVVDDRQLALECTLRPFDATVPYDLRLQAGGARLALGGEIVPRAGPRWSITSGEFSHLDLAWLAHGAPASDLSGSLQAVGRGTSGDSLVLEVQLALAAARIATVPIDSLHAEGALRGGAVTFAARARALGATAQIAAQAHPFAPEPAIDRARVRFQHFDLSRWVPGAQPPTDLTGMLTLAARGLDPQTRHAEARLELAASRVGQQALDSGAFDVELEGQRLASRGQLRYPDGEVAFLGDATPFGAVPHYALERLTFQNLDVGALLGKPALRTQLSGQGSLSGAGAARDELHVQASLALAPSTAFGMSLDGAHAEAGYDAGAVRLVGDLQVPGGSGQFDASGMLGDSTATYRAQGSLRSDDLGRLLRKPLADAGLALEFTAAGEGLDPQTLHLQADLSGSAHVGEVRLDTLAANATLAGHVLQIDSLDVRGNVLRARVAGMLQLPQFLPPAGEELQLTAQVRDPAPLGPVLGLDRLELAQSQVTATLHGNEAGAAAHLVVSARRLAVATLRAARLQADVTGMFDAGRRPLAARGVAMIDSARVGGFLLRRTNLQVAGDTDTLRAHLTTAMDDSTALQAALRTSLRRAGTAVLDTLDLRLGPDRWALRHPVQVEYGRHLRVDDFQIHSGVQRLAVNGTLDREGEQSLEASIDSLHLEPLAALLGWSQLAGLLDGEIQVTGPAPAPRVAGRATLQLRDAGQPVVAVDTRFAHEHGRLDLAARVTNPVQDSLTVAARMPLAVPGIPRQTVAASDSALTPIDVRARTDGFELASLARFLPAHTVSGLGGQLWVDAQASGSRHALNLKGSLRVAQGTVELQSLGVPYSDVSLLATLSGDRVTLENLQVRSGRGTLQAQGDIQLASQGGVDLDVRLDRFRAASLALGSFEASGNLAIDSTLAAPAISGRLTLTDTDIDVSGKTGGSATEVELTAADLRMLEENFGYRPRVSRGGSPSHFAATALGVVVEAGRDTWVRRRANPRLALELSGSVEVRKAPHQPLQLFGRLEGLSQRSYLEQLGRRFDLESGSVVLNGDPTQALIDCRAKWEVPSAGESDTPEATIRLSAKGTIDKLDLGFTSEPAMDENQILSYITTGRPPQGTTGQFGSEAGASDPAKAIAIGQASALVEDLGTSLGLDVLQVRDDGVRGVTMMAGNYMNPKTYLGIRQSATFQTEENSATSTGASTEIEVEYELLQWLLVNCQGGVGDLRLMFRSRFPY